MTCLARSVVALAALTALACGNSPDAAPAPAPPPPVAVAPPPHPSGASPHDLEVFRWVGSYGEAMRSALSAACGTPLDRCSHSGPAERAGCLATAVPECERALEAAREVEGTIPDEVRGPFVAFREAYAQTACADRVSLDLLEAEPGIVGRLRRQDATHESVEEMIFRESEARRGWAVAASARLDACDEAHSYDGALLAPVSTWLRARFGCATPHPRIPGVALPTCCTVERVGAMVAAGIEPGPPRPTCR